MVSMLTNITRTNGQEWPNLSYLKGTKNNEVFDYCNDLSGFYFCVRF